jgi:hypothetical protein
VEQDDEPFTGEGDAQASKEGSEHAKQRAREAAVRMKRKQDSNESQPSPTQAAQADSNQAD